MDSIFAARFDVIHMLDENHKYVLQGKKFWRYEKNAVSRLRSKISEIKMLPRTLL